MTKLIALSLLSLAGAATAATVNVVRAGNGVIATTSTGTVLSTGGYYIGVGSFASVPTVSDVASLQAAVNAFREFAAVTSPTAAGNTQGTITGSFVGTGGATPDNFNSQELFFLVGNAATKALSTEFAILRNQGTWAFPSNVVPGATSITLNLGTVADFNTLPGAGTEIDNAGKDGVQLVAVPEPGVSVLALAGLGLLARRRRN